MMGFAKQGWIGKRASLVPLLGLIFIFAECRNDGKETVEVINFSAAALNDYQGTYAQDKLNKAFAISPDGAYAVGHSFPSTRLAAATALLNCNARVQPGQLECIVYDINGQVSASLPLRLARK